ncbi:molybdenum import ATP-binding protein ModC [Azospira sp. I13]|uniref:molybdenum ABC transporter ATP-binding protein n=1 Tax=Azospira sp. I13 TaxID=1765050 RepID=UPI000D42BE95|nr:molybdenum ABC transporter ATP-binding protein [Azospira sp. I13]GBG02170.1 molybdenum import ATP-binding protein ModC [Azospira sp. I13]
MASDMHKETPALRARFHVAYGEFSLEADLTLPGRGVTALFGHSGSGKTTLLRAIAGLERHPGAYLEVNGEVWQDGDQFLPTHQRPLGYVFQEASLFAHLNVERNLNFGLKRIPAAERRVNLEQAVELLGIGPLLHRQPDKLSGGERQRVAIARALLTSPRLLLMDEPLAALDGKRKAEILPYLTRLRQELDIPVLYVTHSPDEVARLADHLVLLDGGRVAASGPLGETLARLDLPLAAGDDAGVVIEGSVAGHDDTYHLLAVDFPGGQVQVAHGPAPTGTRLRFQVRARDVSLSLSARDDSSILNRVAATITSVAAADTPAHRLVRLEADGTPLLARITCRSWDQLELQPGKRVWAQIKAVALLA